MRTWIVAIGSATPGATASSLAITRGIWWPLAVLAVLWVGAMVCAHYLGRDIKKLDTESEAVDEMEVRRSEAYEAIAAAAPLIAARALELDAAQRAAEYEPCDAEVWSLDYFAGQNIDPYWIRCTRLGPHDEHEDAGNTGAHWKERS